METHRDPYCPIFPRSAPLAAPPPGGSLSLQPSPRQRHSRSVTVLLSRDRKLTVMLGTPQVEQPSSSSRHTTPEPGGSEVRGHGVTWGRGLGVAVLRGRCCGCGAAADWAMMCVWAGLRQERSSGWGRGHRRAGQMGGRRVGARLWEGAEPRGWAWLPNVGTAWAIGVTFGRGRGYGWGRGQAGGVAFVGGAWFIFTVGVFMAGSRYGWGRG